MRPTARDRCLREFTGDFFIGLAVCLAVLALAVLDSRAARSAPSFIAQKTRTEARPPALSPSSVTMGTLFLRPRTDSDSNAVLPAPRLDTNVDITVSGPIARATVTQKFRNPGKQRVAGIYAFPLPGEADVDTLSMHIGKRTLEGRIMRHDEARLLYETAEQAGRKAGRSVRPRPNVFTTAVADIGPGEEITIRIEYQEMLRRNGEDYLLRFPLVAAPRSVPERALHAVRLDGDAGVPGHNPSARNPAGMSDEPVTMRLRLNAGFPLGKIGSETHEITMRRTGENSAVLALSRAQIPTDRDFQLTWRAKETALPLATAFQEGNGENSYVLAMLTPPGIDSAPASPPREVVFVIDTSGSMAGRSLAQVKNSLALALERMKPGDRFNIIRFDSHFESLFAKPAAITGQSLAVATNFISGLEARGGTEPLPALKAALSDTRKDDSKRLRQVVLLTDGAVSGAAELLSHLAAQRGRSRLYTVGIGSEPDDALMRRAAEIGRGSYLHISSTSQVSWGLNRLFERLERPVVTDLKVEWASGLRADVWPNPLPDLYAGEPVLITAQLSGLKGALKFTGKLGGKPWTQTLPMTAAKKSTGAGRFWARRKIASLEARRYAGQPESDVDKAVEAVALEHGLTSRMTRIVPFDVTPAQPANQPLASEELAVELPAGQVYAKTFETSPERIDTGAMRTAAAMPDPGPQGKSASKRLAAPSPGHSITREDITEAAVGPSKLALKIGGARATRFTGPGAAQTGDRTWIFSVMALIFAVMTALTLGLWRHLRHSVAPRRAVRLP